MIEHEFPRVHDGPEHILQGLLLVLVGGHGVEQLLQLVGLRWAGQTPEVKILDDLGGGLFLLQHLADPVAAFRRIVAAVAPGGWMLLEEGDLGLLEFAGAAESARASVVVHDVFARWRAAGVVDSYCGRRLPGLVAALSLAAITDRVSGDRSADG